MSSTTSTRRPYTPPFFSNFGKNTKDLFKKKYEFNNEVKVVGPRTKLGLNVETGVVGDKKSNSTRAYVKTAQSFPDVGVWDSEFHTDSSKESKTTFKFSKLVKGLNAKLGYHTKSTPDAFKAGFASAEFEYTQDYLAATALVKSDLAVTRVEATAAVGYDGLSVGGKAEVDATNSAKLEQFNFGAEYAQSDFTATVFTEKNRNSVTASYHQRLAADHVIGGSFTADLKNNSRSLTVGTDYRVDVDTVLRAKAEIGSASSTVTVSSAVEHRLVRPNALVGVATEFKVVPNSGVETSNLGVQVTFGDF